VVRAFLQRAEICEVFDVESPERRTYPMKRLAKEGFFEAVIPDRAEPFRYRLRIETPTREVRQFFDPYSFLPTLGDQDLYLFAQGNENYIHNKLGAHTSHAHARCLRCMGTIHSRARPGRALQV
jgi:1,4-alpha-glucan branching enzyme